MRRVSLKILKYIAKHGEISLKEAVNLSSKKPKIHKEQYALALLISDEFIGMSVPFPTMKGTEKMPELMGAYFLHMNRLEEDKNGEVKYEGITQSGANFDKEKVFIRSKGFLYLDELRQKRNDIIISFFVGFLSALIPFLLMKI
ncbi:MAG: hypothetical protein COB76_07230 [Alphaproteobacteria bacterium]|nr:MAG: hypothetical protein COB76_07230 [Alphaproteobacteria bacterium]